MPARLCLYLHGANAAAKPGELPAAANIIPEKPAAAAASAPQDPK